MGKETDVEEGKRLMDEFTAKMMEDAENEKREFSIKVGSFVIERGLDGMISITDLFATARITLRPDASMYPLFGNADRLEEDEMKGVGVFLTALWSTMNIVDADFTKGVIHLASEYVKGRMKEIEKEMSERSEEKKKEDEKESKVILDSEKDKYDLEKKIDSHMEELKKETGDA